MGIRPILSHELLVGDYLGVISSMHHPDHVRRVEKLEYVDADLGRRHIHVELRRRGRRHGRKRVARLLRATGPHGRTPRRFKRTTIPIRQQPGART